jgi:pilus assembly protein CpaE
MENSVSRSVDRDQIAPSDATDKMTILAFLNDESSEQALVSGLSNLINRGMDLRRGTIRTAIEQMAHLPTPKVLIIDIANDDQPVDALSALSDLVEPGVLVLLTGDTSDVEFYRHVIKDLGVMEYIPKPITAESVSKYFGPVIGGVIDRRKAPREVRGGTVVSVIGANGGVGTTTISVNLSWFLGSMSRRHTVYVECDLHRGTGALLLNGANGPGLRRALETPDRIDPLFIERAAQPVTERLHLLASQEKLTDQMHYVAGSAQRMIDILRMRYNFAILDVPSIKNESHYDMMDFCHQRIILLEPSFSSIKNAKKLIGMPKSKWHKFDQAIVLNRSGRPGGLTVKQVEEYLEHKLTVVIPDIPKQMGKNATYGDAAVAEKGQFSSAIKILAREIGFNPREETVIKTKKKDPPA